jgi:hypothetical protein
MQVDVRLLEAPGVFPSCCVDLLFALGGCLCRGWVVLGLPLLCSDRICRLEQFTSEVIV